MARKTLSILGIEISGPNVAPETVDVRDLCELLSSLDSAIRQVANDQSPLDDSVRLLSLSGVERGSDRLLFTVAEVAAPALGSVAEALATRDFTGLPDGTQHAFARISRRFVARSWTFRMFPEKGLRIPIAEISAANPIDEPQAPPKGNGTVTVYGRLIRVGGESAVRGSLKRDDDSVVPIGMTEQQAKELAPHLYEEIGLEGDATWDVATRKLEQFTLRRVSSYHATDLVVAFERLAEAAGGQWDEVDAKKFVRGQRSG